MTSITTLAQSLGVAFAAGINVPATVAVLGIADRAGWIDPLPGALSAVGSIWVIALASVIYAMEFVVTLPPEPGPAGYAVSPILIVMSVGVRPNSSATT